MPKEDSKEQRIRERAYFFWIAEGEPDGRDKAHWDAARAAVEDEDRQCANREKHGMEPPPSPSFGP